MRDLINKLNYYTIQYEKGEPVISDKEWDDLYFTLQEMEQTSGIVYPDSPTQTVELEVRSELPKVTHSHPMLSLPKTKDVNIFAEKNNQGYIAMPKMDGLTCSLLYENGELVRAETRGNGEVGEDITHNARVVKNIPKTIFYKDRLVVDGEIICKTNVFEQFFADAYKNPRNFAAGSIRLLDNQECAKRELSFIAWDVIDGIAEADLLSNKLTKIHDYGFETVFWLYLENINYNPNNCVDMIRTMAAVRNYPIDGIVLKINSTEARAKEPGTSHHAGGAIAFKMYDEEYETMLLDIDWGLGRTGEITPVAVFEPIDCEGSVIERASLHNLSMMNKILGDAPYVGQPIRVAKMNEIIPQVVWADKETTTENQIKVIEHCPVCGEPILYKESDSGVWSLYCTNPKCQGKLINRIDHFCSKKGLEIKGLSEATLEKLYNQGWLESIIDIFYLKDHRAEWVKMPGFGPKSVDNILAAIEKARQEVVTDRFIAALGIPLIGTTASKEIASRVADYADFREKVKTGFDFSSWSSFGPEMNDVIHHFDYSGADAIYELFDSEKNAQLIGNTTTALANQVFVITGKLNNYKNRDELKKTIESMGGKVASSVSKNTSYLINNDINSTSSKNAAAKNLNIPIITEQEFLEKFI